jgi:hypothetical protein
MALIATSLARGLAKASPWSISGLERRNIWDKRKDKENGWEKTCT